MALEGRTAWDGIDRRKAASPIGPTALKITGRAVDNGETAVDGVFQRNDDPSLNNVREGDLENGALKARVTDILKVVNRDEKQTAQPESAELDPRLTTFKADFDKDTALQAKCSWAEIQLRLLANEDHYLSLAQAMEQGGELFGVDAEGNPLISDRGDELILNGMNYKDTRDRVLYRFGKSGKMELVQGKKPIPTGYEMFPYVEPCDKSPEIFQYEVHTGKPFVKSPTGDEFLSSWVESGENPSRPRDVFFSTSTGDAYVSPCDPRSVLHSRGVRRLLRVKKA